MISLSSCFQANLIPPSIHLHLLQAESPLLPLKEKVEQEKELTPTRTQQQLLQHISETAERTAGRRQTHSSGATEADTHTSHTATPTHTPTSTFTTPTPTLTPTATPTPPTSSDCRRRSSLTTLDIQEEGEPNNNNRTNNNNNNNEEELFYTPLGSQTPNHQKQHTHDYKLYPQDTFARLEGLAPPAQSKMQSKVDAVGQITGHWGKWQLRTVLLIFLCKIPSSWFMACIIFTAPAPRHGEFFCKPPPSVGNQNQTQWIKVSHPQKEEQDDQEFSIDFCNIYQDAQQHAHHYYNYEDSAQEPRVWEMPKHRNSNVIPCTEFQHESDFHSVVTQYDLVCSRDILVSVTQFFHLFGVLTGGILAHHLLK